MFPGLRFSLIGILVAIISFMLSGKLFVASDAVEPRKIDFSCFAEHINVECALCRAYWLDVSS
jgi:hypothetical protein